MTGRNMVLPHWIGVLIVYLISTEQLTEPGIIAACIVLAIDFVLLLLLKALDP